LGFRRGGFSPPLSLLMSAFSLPAAPTNLAVPPYKYISDSVIKIG